MDYRLVVITHGDCAPLKDTLDSFTENVKPRPSEVVIVYDGVTAPPVCRPPGGTEWLLNTTGEPLGFCGATQVGWAEAAADGPEFVFWLEHDFTFNRPVNLDILAAVLDAEPQVSQMALYRQPVNEEEKTHGGYLNIPGRGYELRRTTVEVCDGPERWPEEFPWWQHRDYWTTNPSLFRRDIPAHLVWPEGPKCEGMFGFMLKAARHATSFGVWGDGEEWVTHTGERTGHGY